MKRIIIVIIILILFIATSVWAVRNFGTIPSNEAGWPDAAPGSVLSSFAGSVNVDHYVIPEVAIASATEADIDVWEMPFGAVVDQLQCRTNVAPGAGTSWAITLRDDAVNTSLTCTISGTAVNCEDVSNTATIAVNSLVTILWDATGAVASTETHGCTAVLRAD